MFWQQMHILCVKKKNNTPQNELPAVLPFTAKGKLAAPETGSDVTSCP